MILRAGIDACRIDARTCGGVSFLEPVQNGNETGSEHLAGTEKS